MILYGNIYGIAQKETEKVVYVGKSKHPFGKRWKDHQRQVIWRHGSEGTVLYHFIRQHGGLEAFYCVLLAEVPIEQLHTKEIDLIQFYKTHISDGGQNVSLLCEISGGGYPSGSKTAVGTCLDADPKHISKAVKGTAERRSRRKRPLIVNPPHTVASHSRFTLPVAVNRRTPTHAERMTA